MTSCFSCAHAWAANSAAKTTRASSTHFSFFTQTSLVNKTLGLAPFRRATNKHRTAPPSFRLLIEILRTNGARISSYVGRRSLCRQGPFTGCPGQYGDDLLPEDDVEDHPG